MGEWGENENWKYKLTKIKGKAPNEKLIGKGCKKGKALYNNQKMANAIPGLQLKREGWKIIIQQGVA